MDRVIVTHSLYFLGETGTTKGIEPETGRMLVLLDSGKMIALDEECLGEV